MRPRAIAAIVVLLWVAVLAVAGPVAGRLASVVENDQTSFLPTESESTRALALEQGFRSSDVVPTLVVYEREGGTTPADLGRALTDVELVRQSSVPLLGEVSPPLPSQDGEALQVFVPLDGSDGDAIIPAVEQLRETLGRDGGPEGLDVFVTGVGGLSADLFAVFETIDSTLLLATATVVVVILLLVYRSPVLWVVPLLAAGLAFVLAAASVHTLVRLGVLQVSGQGQGILTVLVFGAGTDYALLLIARYREELHDHERAADAMRVALRGSVPAVVASAATVVLGLLCLLASELGSNRDLGPVAAVGIVAALLSMTTFLPAVLVLVGRRVFWPRIPHVDGVHSEETGLWNAVARTVARHTRTVSLVTGGLLVVLSLGVVQLEASGIPQSEAITGDAESVEGQLVLGEHFPAGAGTPLVVVGAADRVDALQRAVRLTPDVAAVTPYAESPGGPTTTVDGRVLLDVVLAVPGEGERGARAVEALRASLDAADPQAVVGGFPAIDVDVQQASQRDRVVIIPLVLLVILVVLGVLLRAVVAPLLLVATVVLSFVATLGACAVVFDLLGHPGADSSFPLFAFVFLVALGIDYNIFLMTRVREETVRSGTRTGTLRGLALTGGVITSAGVVLAATFAVLGVLPLLFLSQLGFAVAFGVLLDTLVVRSLLVPALTLQIGDRVWWPSALARGGPSRDRVGVTTLPGDSGA